MIVGLGIDIMSTERIARTIRNFGSQFLERTYTDHEIDTVRHRPKLSNQMYTSYWAVKEAVMKALGTGNRMGVRFKDIEVHHLRTGKPYLTLYGRAKEFLQMLGAKTISVSMSHLEDVVVATVIFEK
jgi:holo-[acyl-carrier protein] synthase